MKRLFISCLLGGLLCMSSYGAYEYFAGGRCNPKGKCKACTTCNYCKNCAKNGGKCSVCK